MGFQTSVNSAIGTLMRASTITSGLRSLQYRDIGKQINANKQAEQLKQAKAQQKTVRRNFMRDYLSKQQTSLGGTVGDLPIEMQKKIASTYDRYARKKMMDKMDEDKKNG